MMLNAAYKIEGETTYMIQYHQKFSLHRRVKNARKFFCKIAEVPQILPKCFVEDMVAELKRNCRMIK
jgi:GMP synthase (glutamine-hydrolysing)